MNRTYNLTKIKEKATKIRALTDEQLVHYIEDRIAKRESEVRNEYKKRNLNAVLNFVDKLNNVQGIGVKLQNRIRNYAKHERYF